MISNLDLWKNYLPVYANVGVMCNILGSVLGGPDPEALKEVVLKVSLVTNNACS